MSTAILKEIESSFCPIYNRIIYFSYFVKFFFMLLIIISLFKIEQLTCNCADIPEKKLIKEWFIFSIIFNLIVLLAFLFSNKACYFYMTNYAFPYVSISLVSFISLIMAIRLIIYLNILRKECKCGYGKLEKFLFWYLIIMFSILSLIILFGIILISFGLINIFKSRYS